MPSTSELRQNYAGQGTEEAELRRIENEPGIQIPQIYRVFLSLIGNNPQAAWVGSDWTSDQILGNRELAEYLLEQNPHIGDLPEDAFVLWSHQGYSVMFVRTSLGDASPVYSYLEGDEPLWHSFRESAPTLDALMMEEAPEPWLDAKTVAADH